MPFPASPSPARPALPITLPEGDSGLTPALWAELRSDHAGEAGPATRSLLARGWAALVGGGSDAAVALARRL